MLPTHYYKSLSFTSSRSSEYGWNVSPPRDGCSWRKLPVADPRSIWKHLRINMSRAGCRWRFLFSALCFWWNWGAITMDGSYYPKIQPESQGGEILPSFSHRKRGPLAPQSCVQKPASSLDGWKTPPVYMGISWGISWGYFILDLLI